MRISTRVIIDMESGEVLLQESYQYSGPVELCCGPSGAEQNIAAEEQSIASTLSADFGQRFANQNEVLQTLNQGLTPVFAAGPNQQGFSPAELAARNTQAINASAAAARNARQAAGNFAAGQNTSSGLTSGVTRQINAAIGSNATNQVATAQNQITAENYATGRENYFRAAGGLQALGQAYNPEAFGSEATSANQSAFGEADKIQSEKNAEQATLAGGIASLATNFVIPGASAAISAINPNADTSFLDALG